MNFAHPFVFLSQQQPCEIHQVPPGGVSIPPFLEDPPRGVLRSLASEDMHRRLSEVSELAETHLRRASEAEEEVRWGSRKQQSFETAPTHRRGLGDGKFVFSLQKIFGEFSLVFWDFFSENCSPPNFWLKHGRFIEDI